MATRLHGKHIITVLLALLVLVPASVSYAQNQEGKRQKVEKFIELAEKAMDKTETLINITYANTTAMENITDAGLYDYFMANVSLFDKAAQNVTNAQERLDAGDLEGATANVTYALGVFREVYKAVNRILAATPGLERGQLVDAQGLIQAMKRALERIDRLEDLGDLPDETTWLLGNATLYLNVTEAIEWLQAGRVNETAHNKTMANKLISEAHRTLKKTASELNAKRIENYLKIIENLYDRLLRQVEKAIDKGLDAEDLNATLVNEIRPIIDQAQNLYDQDDYPAALAELEDARTLLEEVEQGLKDLRRGPKK